MHQSLDQANWLQMAQRWQRMADNHERKSAVRATPDLIPDQDPTTAK
jgi:hypothetical protein